MSRALHARTESCTTQRCSDVLLKQSSLQPKFMYFCSKLRPVQGLQAIDQPSSGALHIVALTSRAVHCFINWSADTQILPVSNYDMTVQKVESSNVSVPWDIFNVKSFCRIHRVSRLQPQASTSAPDSGILSQLSNRCCHNLHHISNPKDFHPVMKQLSSLLPAWFWTLGLLWAIIYVTWNISCNLLCLICLNHLNQIV